MHECLYPVKIDADLSVYAIIVCIAIKKMVWYGNCLFDIYKRHNEKIASNTTILNTRVYNVWRLHIKNRLGFLLACSHRNIVDIYICI